MFGELAMFNSEQRSATVQALEDSSALALLAGDMRRMLLQHPHIAVNMLSWMSDRLRAANERIARQSFQTVASRVAGALLAQVQARSVNEPNGEPAREVTIRATQSEIAQLAGASRESASRFLARLERDGVVTTGRGKVLVHEPSALRNYIWPTCRARPSCPRTRAATPTGTGRSASTRARPCPSPGSWPA
jgi:CRP/FNR family transcriptional regulator